MAIINPTIVRDVSPSGTQLLVTWALVNAGDVGAPLKLDKYTLQTWSIYGTTITAVALNGSNDPVIPSNWNALRDWTGGSLGAIAAAGLYSPRDMPLWIQPVLTTGAAVTFAVLLHRQDVSAVG
jgi:hypothetical protein